MKLYYKNTELKDLPNELWVDIFGFDGIYQVSNLGRIKSLSRWQETRPGVGYIRKEMIIRPVVSEKNSNICVTLSTFGVAAKFIVARLMFFSFNYNVKNLPEYFVMHKDGNWKNNTLKNLKIATRSEIEKLKFHQKKSEHLKNCSLMLSKHKIVNAIKKNETIDQLKCINCGKTKPINFFRKHRNCCEKCDAERWHFIEGKKRVKGFELKETEIETGKTRIYRNLNDKNLTKKVSIGTAMKYAKSGEICKPRPQSKHNFSPFILEILKPTT
jgi:hypothetical protein